MSEKAKKEYMSLEEVAELLGVRYQLIYRLVRDGELAASRVGRIYRVSRRDVEEFMARTRTVPEPAFRCSLCAREYASQTSMKGECTECGAPICVDCWSRKKARHCAEHQPDE